MISLTYSPISSTKLYLLKNYFAFNVFDNINNLFLVKHLKLKLSSNLVYSNLNFFNIFVFKNVLLGVIIFGVLFFIFTYGIKLIGNSNSYFDNYYTFYSYFNDVEEELGAFDDVVSYIFVFGLLIVWFFFLTTFSGFVFKSLSWVFSLTNIVALTSVFVPVFVLKNFGLAFVHYVRGSGRTSSLFFEGLLDFISTLVIMLRFVIQNIRFVFIFAAFFEIYEFIYNKFFFDVNYWFNFSDKSFFLKNTYSNWYWYELISHFFVTWGLYLYYLGHLTLLFIAQLITYFALSFWLFFFLYTTFVLETHEKYFFFSRVS